MKKSLVKILFIAFFSTFILLNIQSSKVSAFECANGETIEDSLIPSFVSGADNINAAKDAFCAIQGNGGLANTAPIPCSSTTSFLGFPYWYKYLDTQLNYDTNSGLISCDIQLNSINDVWLVVAAIIEILLRLSALLAVGFIIYGGVLYILSQSQPDKVNQALKTTINAVIGLVIAISATALVTFLAGSFN